MPIYLLTEQVMNGTVTMQIISTGIEAETFKKAVKKVKALPNMRKAVIKLDTDKEFSYTCYNFITLSCYGRMENQVLKII